MYRGACRLEPRLSHVPLSRLARSATGVAPGHVAKEGVCILSYFISILYLLAARHVRVFRPQGMSRMSSTRRAHVTTGVQGGRSGPPAPHPLLTSLAAQPASGDANILTSGECELLRRDAKVRRRRPPRVALHSHRLVHLDDHGRASCHVRSACLCLQRARWPGARRCVERCSTPSPQMALIGMEASARSGPVAPTT